MRLQGGLFKQAMPPNTRELYHVHLSVLLLQPVWDACREQLLHTICDAVGADWGAYVLALPRALAPMAEDALGMCLRHVALPPGHVADADEMMRRLNAVTNDARFYRRGKDVHTHGAQGQL